MSVNMNKFKEWLKNKAANLLDEGPYLSGAVLHQPVRKKLRSKPKLRHEPESSQNPIPWTVFVKRKKEQAGL